MDSGSSELVKKQLLRSAFVILFHFTKHVNSQRAPWKVASNTLTPFAVLRTIFAAQNLTLPCHKAMCGVPAESGKV